MSTTRARWAALGAAAAVALGGGGLLTADAGLDSGERAVFVPIAPCRLFDTRPAPDTVGARNTALAPGDTFTAQVTGTNGNCTLPAGAVAVTMNVVVVSPTADSFLTVFPADVARPLASSLNWEAGQAPTPNAVTVELSATGAVNFYNLACQVHVAVDVVGYHVDHTHDDRYYTKAQADQRVADAVDDRPGWPSRLTAAQVAREQWWADPAKPLTAQVGISPYGMLFDGEHVWVSNNGAGTVTKLVASTGAVVGTYPAGNLPGLMAFDGEHVWVVNGTPNTVTKLDADTGAQVGSALSFATDPSGIVFDGDSIWVADVGANRIFDIDPTTNAVTEVALTAAPNGLAFDGTHVWATLTAADQVVKIDAATRVPGAPVVVAAAGPLQLASDGQYMWVTSGASNTVSKLAPNGSSVAGVAVAGNPSFIVYDGSYLWVSRTADDRITRIHAATATAVASSIDTAPRDLVFDGRNVWLASTTGIVHRFVP